jgi:hypothetical protein
MSGHFTASAKRLRAEHRWPNPERRAHGQFRLQRRESRPIERLDAERCRSAQPAPALQGRLAGATEPKGPIHAFVLHHRGAAGTRDRRTIRQVRARRRARASAQVTLRREGRGPDERGHRSLFAEFATELCWRAPRPPCGPRGHRGMRSTYRTRPSPRRAPSSERATCWTSTARPQSEDVGVTAGSIVPFCRVQRSRTPSSPLTRPASQAFGESTSAVMWRRTASMSRTLNASYVAPPAADPLVQRPECYATCRLLGASARGSRRRHAEGLPHRSLIRPADTPEMALSPVGGNPTWPATIVATVGSRLPRTGLCDA